MVNPDWAVLLDNVKRVDGVEKAIIITRTGVFVEGDIVDRAYQDTFSAMNAIIFGAAETAVQEFKESVNNVTIELSEKRIFIESIKDKWVIVLITESDADINNIKEKIAKIVSKTKFS